MTSSTICSVFNCFQVLPFSNVKWAYLLLDDIKEVTAGDWDTKREVTDYGEFLRLSMRDGDVRLPKVQGEEPLKAQDSAFVRAVREGSVPRSDGSFALGVVRTLRRIAEALA